MTAATIIFAGPSLPRDPVGALPPGAILLPPARQGDLYRAVQRYRPNSVGVIDGFFQNVPAVWHREILATLDAGVTVFGAASMGALRAAEMAEFGMIGVGKIFAAYRDGFYPPFDEPFEDDDEVAIVHAPVEIGGAALSDAMVDIRETLIAAEAAGILDRAQRDALAGALKALHFPHRSFDALAEAAAVRIGAAAEAFRSWLRHNKISQKERDAIELLRRMTDPAPARPPPSFRMERALVWENFIAEVDATPIAETEAIVLRELGLDPAAWHAAAQAALGRLAPIGSPSEEGDRRAELDTFRRARGLMTRAALDAWLTENRADEAELRRLISGERRLAAAIAAAPRERLRRAIVDHLRLTGDFALLRKRAGAKAETLEGQTADPSPPASDGALAWYFSERLSVAAPASLTAHAVEVGYQSETEFRNAVWREYLYTLVGGERVR